MSSTKEKKLRKLKKAHIWPYFIIIFFYFIFCLIIQFAFIETFFSYVMENQLDYCLSTSSSIVKYIDHHMKNSDTVDNSIYIYGEDVSYALYDKDENLLLASSDETPDLKDNISYHSGDYYFIIDDMSSAEQYFAENNGEYSINTASTFNSFMESFKDSKMENANWSSDKAFEIGGWLVIPIEDLEQTLYVKENLTLRNKDIVYLLGLLTCTFTMAVIPLILFIITALRAYLAQKRTGRLLYFDPMTGEHNWMYFKHKVNYLLRKRKSRQRNYAMISLRLDRYQNYCICYGTRAGEMLIEQMSRDIKKSIGKKNYYARYAEAEFGILLNIEDAEDCNRRIEAIIDIIQAHKRDNAKISFSVGIAQVTQTERLVDKLYNNASIARRNVAKDSPNRIVWFNEELKEEQLWENWVNENMEHALAANEFQVYLQPKYNATNHELGGAEALIRWISPTEGFIGPGRFIPIFEKNGFITKIDDFMLASVSKLQADWATQGKKIVPISVNISRAHFTQEDLAEHICKIVEDANAPKEFIELELTESAFFDDKDILLKTVNRLKEMGFAISMDDFGAGYSSLNSLKDLPLDVVKLDAEFFRGEDSKERGEIVVQEAIQLAKNLNMRIVAEGIETKDQVDFLADHGCDLIQGFYFAKPMPVADYIETAFKDE